MSHNIRRYILPYKGKNTKFVLAENHEAKVEALTVQLTKLHERVKELRAQVKFLEEGGKTCS